MAVIDEINTKYHADRHQQNTLLVASEGIREKHNWQMNH